MNSWKKLPGERWGIMVADPGAKPGDVVTVTNRDGRTKTATLGRLVETTGWGTIFEVAETAKPQAQTVGDMTGVLRLFEKAREHLKFPAIVLAVPAADLTLRLTVAGAKAKIPGSITVCDQERTGTEDQRDWLGRILTDGTYQPSNATNGRAPAIAARLAELAAEPAKTAAEHGRLTGRCCFCNTRLTDDRSTAVGYGETCAGHWGLPWGAERFSFTATEGR